MFALFLPVFGVEIVFLVKKMSMTEGVFLRRCTYYKYIHTYVLLKSDETMQDVPACVLIPGVVRSVVVH